MESSFTKTYEKKQKSDGSIDLKFESRKFGGNSIGFFIAWFMPSLFLTWKIVEFVGDGLMRNNLSGGQAFILWLVCELIVWIVPVRLLIRALTQDESITVLPNQGVMFGGKNLPYNDMQTLGTQARGAHRKNSFVYAVSHGTNIKMTGYMALDLAEALANEIRNYSGATWK